MTIGGERLAIKAATMRSFRRYHSIVQDGTQGRSQALEECATVIYALADGKAEYGAVWSAEAAEIIAAGRQINAIMRDRIPAAMNRMSGCEPVEMQKSAFDEYDKENGYDDDAATERREQYMAAADAVIRAAINVCGCSYTEAADENAYELLGQIDHYLRNKKE